MNPDIYTPEQEEIDKEEEMTAKKHHKIPEHWAQLRVQEQPPWEDFGEKIDDNFERRRPSSEAVQKINKSLEELSMVFEGSDVNWHLDGALNISLMNGAGENPDNYIGEHKDVDISVEKSDLEALEAQLLKAGYGLFLSRTDDKANNKVLRRVGHRYFTESASEHLLIAAIDENGKIRNDKTLNFIDIHIIQRDKDGRPLGILGTPIPEKWAQPQLLEFHGKHINISHPGKVLYYKLHQGRNYDITDVQKLIETGKISNEDIDDIEKIYEDEFKARIERGRKMFEGIIDQIKPGMNANEILLVIQGLPEFKKRKDMDDEFKKLSQKIAEAEDMSVDNILNIAITLFRVEEMNDQKRQELNRIRQKVKDVTIKYK